MQVPLQQKLDLLRLLLQHERERLETWAKPLEPGASSASAADAAWKQRVNTAWTVDPRLGLALLDRHAIAPALHSSIDARALLQQAQRAGLLLGNFLVASHSGLCPSRGHRLSWLCCRFPAAEPLRAELEHLVEKYAHRPSVHGIPGVAALLATPSAARHGYGHLQALQHWTLAPMLQVHRRSIGTLTPVHAQASETAYPRLYVKGFSSVGGLCCHKRFELTLSDSAAGAGDARRTCRAGGHRAGVRAALPESLSP